MTDRPRTWLLVECPDCASSSSAHRIEGGPVDVVEWDREKVVPVVMAAIQTYLGAGEGDTYDPRGEADAIFDALDRIEA